MKDNKLFLKSPIKWAGGKSKLMNKIQEVYNNDFFWNSEKHYKEFEIKTLDGVQRNIRPTAERKVQEILIYNL